MNKYTLFLLIFFTTAFSNAQTVDANLLQQLRHGEASETITRTDVNGIPAEGSVFFDATTKRIYVYKDSAWKVLLDETGAWKVDGNSNTNPTTDYIGSTDAKDVVFKANSQERMRLAEDRTQVQLNGANDFGNHPLVIRASGNDILAFQDENGNIDWHWNLIGNGLNFVESGVADFRLYLEDGGNIGINTSNPEATLDINAVNNEVPLRIRPSTTIPIGTNSGELFVASNGLLYAYDVVRLKWLSVDRTTVGWGRSNNMAASISGEYLRQFNGSLSSNNGWRMIRNGTITAITVQSNNVDTFEIQIRKNDGVSPITSLAVTNAQGAHATDLNIDFVAGDFLQCYLPPIFGGVSNPQVLIEIAWRK